MPISEEHSVAANIKRLAKSHPEFPPKQRVAVSESEARRADKLDPGGRHKDPKDPPRRTSMAKDVEKNRSASGVSNDAPVGRRPKQDMPNVKRVPMPHQRSGNREEMGTGAVGGGSEGITGAHAGPPGHYPVGVDHGEHLPAGHPGMHTEGDGRPYHMPGVSTPHEGHMGGQPAPHHVMAAVLRARASNVPTQHVPSGPFTNVRG